MRGAAPPDAVPGVVEERRRRPLAALHGPHGRGQRLGRRRPPPLPTLNAAGARLGGGLGVARLTWCGRRGTTGAHAGARLGRVLFRVSGAARIHPWAAGCAAVPG
ncbi:hypothetical protein [Streptomyces malaysiensis]|uniref:hypothetical protein n=1 Tax=Streptomyces malaysiensis TaxID=92644 RepID=UPI00115E855F